jgi:8-oxo-dGTP diphosphatase
MTGTDKLSEEDATAKSVLRIVDELLHSGEDAVLCTHRPVLPAVYDALGIPPEHQATGELVVVHHRRGRVRALERHLG